MEGTLNLLYDYARDLEFLIEKASELASKGVLRDKLMRFYKIDSEDFSFSEAEYLISLSRILANYGFCQTYESFKNACSLLLADYDHSKGMVDMAVDKLKKSASRLYAEKTAAGFLWKAHEVSDPWALFVEMLIGSDSEAIARRNYYLRRVLESLASDVLYNKTDEVALNLSPLRLEMGFILNDGILPEVLSLHTNKTDLC